MYNMHYDKFNITCILRQNIETLQPTEHCSENIKYLNKWRMFMGKNGLYL